LTNHHSPLVRRRSDPPKFPGEELVVIASPLLSHKTSKGYTSPYTRVVAEINGVPVKNLRHLVELLRDSKEDHIIIGCDDKDDEVLVFDRNEILEASEEILTENGIRRAYSDDLKAVWEKAEKTQ
jgi:hypothetical protein